VGAVAGDGRAPVSLERAVDAEDTIEVWTSRGRFAQTVGPLELSGRPAPSAPGGARPLVRFEEPVSPGDRVFRVRNAALSAAASRSFAHDSGFSPVELDFEVTVITAEPLRVRVCDSAGRCGEATGPLVEPARTKTITAEEVAEHVGRLGNTPFVARTWHIDLAHGAGASYSALHRVRAEALADYERCVFAEWSRAPRHPVPSRLAASVRRRGPGAAPRLVASVPTLESAERCLAAGADEVHLPAWALADVPPVGVVPLLPRVAHDRELEREFERLRAGRVVAGTLGALERATRLGLAAEAHWSLNAANAYTVAELDDLGAGLVWLSPELTGEQIEGIAGLAASGVGVGVLGRQELMVTEHCILMAEGSCDQRCGSCARRSAPRYLKDRKGYRFPVMTDPTGRSHLYNAVPLDLLHVVGDLARAGVAAVRADLETETAEQAERAVMRARRALDEGLIGARVEREAGSTTGHYFRGVS